MRSEKSWQTTADQWLPAVPVVGLCTSGFSSAFRAASRAAPLPKSAVHESLTAS